MELHERRLASSFEGLLILMLWQAASKHPVQRRGVEWSGVEWSGVEWSGVEWSGVEWSGVEWSGVEGVEGVE